MRTGVLDKKASIFDTQLSLKSIKSSEIAGKETKTPVLTTYTPGIIGDVQKYC